MRLQSLHVCGQYLLMFINAQIFTLDLDFIHFIIIIRLCMCVRRACKCFAFNMHKIVAHGVLFISISRYIYYTCGVFVCLCIIILRRRAGRSVAQENRVMCCACARFRVNRILVNKIAYDSIQEKQTKAPISNIISVYR